jgi:putative transcription factor
MSHQDWQPIVLTKRKPAANSKVTDVTKAKMSGIDTITEKKANAGTNALKDSTMTKVKRDAMNSEDPGHIDLIDKKVSQRIQARRTEKGLSRKQLAQKINEKETLLADYENGKAIPSASVLNKIERALGVSVRK